jgi:hypothetical protein
MDRAATTMLISVTVSKRGIQGVAAVRNPLQADDLAGGIVVNEKAHTEDGTVTADSDTTKSSE